MTVLFWYWLAAAGLLVAAEIVLPGFALIWLGIAAALTGLVAWLAPGLGWPLQLVLFAVFALVSVTVGLKVFPNRPERTDQPLLNQKTAQLVGRTGVLAEPIIGGEGKMRIGDTLWPVTGPDLPEGARVRVTAAGDTVLTIAAIGDAVHRSATWLGGLRRRPDRWTLAQALRPSADGPALARVSHHGAAVVRNPG